MTKPKKDYSNIVYIVEPFGAVKDINFIRLKPMVNGRYVYIDAYKWDGNVSGVMTEIYKRCGFMENHLYRNVKQNLTDIKNNLHRIKQKMEDRGISLNDVRYIVMYDESDRDIGKMEPTSISISKTSLYEPQNITIEGHSLYLGKQSHYAHHIVRNDLKIKDVKFNDPATIVFWADGTKTVVKCQDDDIFDPEKGLAMAISKKALGNKGNYCNEFKKWLPEKEEPTIITATIKPFEVDEMRASIKRAIKNIENAYMQEKE